METKKPTYGFDYWISELQLAGAKINPEKFTPEYTATMQKAWRKQPLTDLVARTVKRRKEAATGSNYVCHNCNHNQGINDYCRKCGHTNFEQSII